MDAYKAKPCTWSHERQIAQLKIEQANREALDAHCKLWTARQLMKEAGVTDDGLAQINRALHESSGWKPEEFMPDYLPSEKFSAYWADRYHQTAYVDEDDLADAIAMYGKHRQLKSLTIVTHDDDLIGRSFQVRWTFYNDGRVGYIGEAPIDATRRRFKARAGKGGRPVDDGDHLMVDSNGNSGASACQADIDERERNS